MTVRFLRASLDLLTCDLYRLAQGNLGGNFGVGSLFEDQAAFDDFASCLRERVRAVGQKARISLYADSYCSKCTHSVPTPPGMKSSANSPFLRS
jgi:hypothetical protein